jgi:hypothetical protein
MPKEIMMERDLKIELLALRIVVALLAFIPIAAGMAGMFAGPHMIAASAPSLALNSHYRYLSGLLAAIGLVFYSALRGLNFIRQGYDC